MKVLELFAGSRSFSKVAEELGMETYTTDYKPFDKINQVCDIMDFNIEKMYDEFGGIIKFFDPEYFYIENPRGVLRKLPVITNEHYIRNTVWYCQYADKRAKPTDIWTNDFGWLPRPVCKNGNPNCHHERAPRGSKTGTQGLKGNYERSIVPYDLCYEILYGIKKSL